jgi:hypothetical protein
MAVMKIKRQSGNWRENGEKQLKMAASWRRNINQLAK